MAYQLVGAAEAAAILRVSRQRVSALSQNRADFPKPVAVLAAGKIWRLRDIERWAARNPDKRGRAHGTLRATIAPWSEQSRALIVLASSEAARLNHDWLGPDHVVLAMLSERSPGLARAVLEAFGLDHESSVATFLQALGAPRTARVAGQLVSVVVQLALERAVVHAMQLNARAVKTEHVLLALSEQAQQSVILAGPPILCFDDVLHGIRAIGRGSRSSGRLRGALAAKASPPQGDWQPPSPVPDLALSASGGSPYELLPWSSADFVDGDGVPIRSPNGVIEHYLVDQSGNPVLTTEGSPVRLLTDAEGRVVPGPSGVAQLTAVKVEPGWHMRGAT